MKTKKKDLLQIGLFCGFLAVMLGLYLVLPKQDFSQREKRELKQMPAFTWENLSSGQLDEQMESYLADHIPGRDFLVGLANYYDLFSGRQVVKKVYTTSLGGLVEAPAQWDQTRVDKNMTYINAFAEKANTKVDLMLIPSAGFVQNRYVQGLQNPYTDDEMIEKIYTMAGKALTVRNVTPLLTAYPQPEDLYYRTDHHWTSLGAYTVYRGYMEMLGKDYAPAQAFTVETVEDFRGATYNTAGLWLVDAEPLQLWHSQSPLTVTRGQEQPHPGVFYREQLESGDKYTVFLGGNSGLVRIDNEANAGQGKLLVIRDSYANCAGAFFAESYESVVMVDLRYYKEPVSQLLEKESFSQVLICYSLGNFLTDSNIVWLE